MAKKLWFTHAGSKTDLPDGDHTVFSPCRFGACLKIQERGGVGRDPPQPVLNARAFWQLPGAAAGLRHSRAPFSDRLLNQYRM
jgi:hypothetical protein